MEEIKKPEENNTPKKHFEAKRVYVKEQSFKLSRSPQLFKENWKPEINMEMQIKNELVEESFYEVLLQISVTLKNGGLTACVAEVHQAGIFELKGFTDKEKERLLSTYAPSILYPYASKVISSMSVEATVAPIMLVPVNFDSIYARRLKEQEKQKGDGNAGDDANKTNESHVIAEDQGDSETQH